MLAKVRFFLTRHDLTGTLQAERALIIMPVSRPLPVLRAFLSLRTKRLMLRYALSHVVCVWSRFASAFSRLLFWELRLPSLTLVLVAEYAFGKKADDSRGTQGHS